MSHDLHDGCRQFPRVPAYSAKGKPVSCELDKVFSSQASQQDVSVAPAERGTERHTSHEGGEMGEGWTKINVREGRQDGEA